MKSLFKGVSFSLVIVAMLVFYILTTCSCSQKYTCPTYSGATKKGQYMPYDDSIGRMAKASQKIGQKARKENMRSSTHCDKKPINMWAWLTGN